MGVIVPGVSEAEIEKLILTIIENFEPRMTRIEDIMLSIFCVIAILILFVLLFSLYVAMHVVLQRRATHTAQNYKLYKKTSIDDDESTLDDEEEESASQKRHMKVKLKPVSYTHLTLPTNREV